MKPICSSDSVVDTKRFEKTYCCAVLCWPGIKMLVISEWWGNCHSWCWSIEVPGLPSTPQSLHNCTQNLLVQSFWAQHLESLSWSGRGEIKNLYIVQHLHRRFCTADSAVKYTSVLLLFTPFKSSAGQPKYKINCAQHNSKWIFVKQVWV